MESDGTFRPVESDPLFGFRPARRRIANRPDAYVKTSVVPVGDEDMDWIDYKLQTYSVPDETDRTTFHTFVEWIDRNGEAHQVHLPGRVVDRLMTHVNSLQDEANSRRAKRAAFTRKTKKRTTASSN